MKLNQRFTSKSWRTIPAPIRTGFRWVGRGADAPWGIRGELAPSRSAIIRSVLRAWPGVLFGAGATESARWSRSGTPGHIVRFAASIR